ncbi:hypothetical protein GCM10028857_13950 [Salinarchaeum chitinilyticum]
MVHRRTIIKRSIELGALASLGTTVAAQQSGVLVHGFDGTNWPGANDLENWAGAGSFANGGGNGEVSNGALRLEYENAGWFASNVRTDVSSTPTLNLRIRGDSGGEEDDILLDVGGVRGLLGDLADGGIGTSYSTLSVDLQAAGADLANPQSVRLNFWQGASGAVDVDSIAFGDVSDGSNGDGGGDDGGGGNDDNDSDNDDGGDAGWDVPFPDRPPEPDTLPDTITADTTVAELCQHFDDPYYVPRDFLDYMPGQSTSDAAKAEQFDYDATAVENHVQDGSLTLGQLGTQALPWVKQLAANDFPAHGTVKLLPRLALLPDETEDPGTHDTPTSVWSETAGPVTATNDPDQLIQDRWPTDARTYRQMGVRVRDRIHDQPQYDESREWGSSAPLPDSVYGDSSNPVLDAAANKVHPVTGDSLGGSGFTANAPMEASVEMHVVADGYWNQYIELKNVSEVPYFQDGAVIWWLGPTGEASNLADGHWNNPHRPSSSLGHPQRDVIEVDHPGYHGLSAYAVRLANHDEPYHMRTIYPNQAVAMEIGTPASVTSQYWSTAAERQALVDTMLDSLHVELETDLDRNDPILDAVDLTYRVPN